MTKPSKLFIHRGSQAVRLPADCRFDCTDVFIRKDSKTGDVIISKRPGGWEEYSELLQTLDVPKDFMEVRELNTPTQDRELF